MAASLQALTASRFPRPYPPDVQASRFPRPYPPDVQASRFPEVVWALLVSS